MSTLKYKEVQVGFSEVPEEVALCINISGCPLRCGGCHSKHLWEDDGEVLSTSALSDLIAKNDGITCVAFMGGDKSPKDVDALAEWVKENTSLKTCWYSGRTLIDNMMDYKNWDFVKTGPYRRDLGGLDSPKTNQRMYKVIPTHIDGICYYLLADMTYKFQKNVEYKTLENETDNKSEGTE